MGSACTATGRRLTLTAGGSPSKMVGAGWLAFFGCLRQGGGRGNTGNLVQHSKQTASLRSLLNPLLQRSLNGAAQLSPPPNTLHSRVHPRPSKPLRTSPFPAQ